MQRSQETYKLGVETFYCRGVFMVHAVIGNLRARCGCMVWSMDSEVCEILTSFIQAVTGQQAAVVQAYAAPRDERQFVRRARISQNP